MSDALAIAASGLKAEEYHIDTAFRRCDLRASKKIGRGSFEKRRHGAPRDLGE